MNGYNFTDRVRKVLQMAREEAARLHHEYVGTEHILLGLLKEGEGVAVAVLTNLNVDLEEIQQKIEETIKKGSTAAAVGPDVPYTSRAKKVLELAMAHARELEHNYVGTEHLLLGLMREEKGIAAQVLKDAGLQYDKAVMEALRLLGHGRKLQQELLLSKEEMVKVCQQIAGALQFKLRLPIGWSRCDKCGHISESAANND